MKPGYLTLPTIWRGCTWQSVQIQWLNQDGIPLNLSGWVPRAFTRHFNLNAIILDAATGMTQVSMTRFETSTLSQGVEDWDWVWLQEEATGTTLPPMIKGKVVVRHPVTNPEAVAVPRIGGGSNYVTTRSQGPHFNLLGRYDQYAGMIREQLSAMRSAGQNHIGIFCWYDSGLTWPDPQNPPQKVPPNGDYANRPWVSAHTLIPWHATNPYPFPPDPAKIIDDATLSPQSLENLKNLLSLLEELEFEQVNFRFGAAGGALLPDSDPVPPNDDFANAILLTGITGQVTGTTVGASRQPSITNPAPPPAVLSESPEGGEATVWYKLVGDDHVWGLQISRPQRAVIEAFHGPDVYHLTLDAISLGNVSPPQPCVFHAYSGTTYYIRVGESGYTFPSDGAPNTPDYFILSWKRDAGVNEPAVPPYPLLPVPPDGWDDGAQAQYTENSAFIRNVTALVEANKGPLRVFYDLMPDGASGRTFYSNTHRYYLSRIWGDWSGHFGLVNSCAASAVSPGYGVGYMIDLFKGNNLPLPGFYALNSYGNELDGLTRIYNRLKAEGGGEKGKKIFIFETFYNDPQVASDTRKALATAGLNFAGIQQWPRSRGASGDFPFPDSFPQKFDQYFSL